MYTLRDCIYSPPSGTFSLDWNILFSYWSMVSFKATQKPLYLTYWWSNHFLWKWQNFYKITANELVSSMVSWGSVSRTKSYLSVLFTVAYVFTVGTECHAVASTVQWETAHIGTSPPFPPRWLQNVNKGYSHLPILPNFALSCCTPISFTFSWGSRDCEKLSFGSNVSVLYYLRGG